MSAAVVLAGPERKRILREILSLPEPWPPETRDLYERMLLLEFRDSNAAEYIDVLAEKVRARTFGDLVLRGVPLEAAHEQATVVASEQVREHKREHSPGRQERQRRRAFREAVTAFDGAKAVTTGLVEACIVCGAPFRSCRGTRPWRFFGRTVCGSLALAYCSNACRQKAYRRRKAAGRSGEAAA